MATKDQVFAAYSDFMDALDGPGGTGLANDGGFSDQEREDFRRLRSFLLDPAVGDFNNNPKHGDSSPTYDGAVTIANNGTTSCARCRPGNNASQEDSFDLSHAGEKALISLTGLKSLAPLKPGG